MSNNSSSNKTKNNLSDRKVKLNSSNRSNSKEKVYDESIPNYHLIPIFFILCVIPLIVRMKVYNPNMLQFAWFSAADTFNDFFLYYKQWLLILVAGIMVIIVAYKAYHNREEIKFTPIFVPLAIYGLLALLSTIFSKYASFAFKGSFEQFESIFALLGYCIITYYAYLFIKTENDLRKIVKYLIIIAIILSILGLTQYLGHDFFGTRPGYKLIMPPKYQDGSKLTFSFEANRVYLTFYNPNYVGSYVALIAPIIMIMLFFQRNIKNIILSVVALLGLIVCVVGAQSLAGVMGLGVALLCTLVFMWRYLVKRFYITIPVALLVIIGLIVLSVQTDNLLINKVVNTVKNSKTDFALTQMDTNANDVSLTYNGNKMSVQYVVYGEQIASVIAVDENNQTIFGDMDATTNAFTITDERFVGITLGMSQDIAGAFYIQESGVQWLFTNQTGDGTYYHINRMGKLDKMITAPSVVFTGYEKFATNRGYIWSRTLPILKNYIFLGSGPDTFTMVYPQQDYINFARFGYGTGIITKPHSMYLQIATQTGILSLIAFLVFYMMYFISSIRLYIKGRFHSYYSQIGIAIFVGTIAYMVTGITNDSSITTAPFFWTMIGVGLAVNYKAKPLIKEEVVSANSHKKAVVKLNG